MLLTGRTGRRTPCSRALVRTAAARAAAGPARRASGRSGGRPRPVGILGRPPRCLLPRRNRHATCPLMHPVHVHALAQRLRPWRSGDPLAWTRRVSHASPTAHDEAAPDPSDPAYWDARYGESGRVWSGDPNGALVDEAAGLAPGRALDVGCGEGADAIWLASQGWRTTGLDVSIVALGTGPGQRGEGRSGRRVAACRPARRRPGPRVVPARLGPVPGAGTHSGSSGGTPADQPGRPPAGRCCSSTTTWPAHPTGITATSAASSCRSMSSASWTTAGRS